MLRTPLPPGVQRWLVWQWKIISKPAPSWTQLDSFGYSNRQYKQLQKGSQLSRPRQMPTVCPMLSRGWTNQSQIVMLEI